MKSWSTLEGIFLIGDVTDDGLAVLEGMRGLNFVSITSHTVNDEGLKHIGKLKNLENLTLRKCNVKGSGLRELAGLSKLKTLDLSLCPVTDDGLKNLKGMELVSLDLGGTKITHRGIDEIKDMATLKKLCVYDTKVTNVAIGKLTGIHNLSIIGLPREEAHEIPDNPADVAAIEAAGISVTKDNVTDNVYSIRDTCHEEKPGPWMAHLRGLHNLREFEVPLVTEDDDLAAIEGMKSLRSLKLWGIHLTDAGLKHLRGLVNLKKLSIHSGKITGAGLAHLDDLKNLEWLELYIAALDDRGIQNLPALKTLKELSVYNRSLITDAGLSHMREFAAIEQI